MALVVQAPAARLLEKAQHIEIVLTDAYGARVWRRSDYSQDIIGALIATVLSQNTSDINSGRAFASLKAAFPSGWDEVRLAPVDAIADSIRVGGLADIKASRLQRILTEIFERTGSTSLDRIAGWDDQRIEDFLRSFHGVGAKTAACVLMFNLGRPVLPVDTHVHRVARRIGLIGPKVTAEAAHKLLGSMVRPDQVYSFHVHLIEHGRRTCRSRRPLCGVCPISSECDYVVSMRESEA